MPAYTAAQLSAILGSGEYNYVAPRGDFNTALAQVLPRLMAMGLWRDTTYEISLPNKYGYVSLPEDTDAVLAATVNNRARPVRSMWHDIRITGRHATLSPYYGVVDAGWYPVLLDFADTLGAGGESNADEVGLDELSVYYAGSESMVDDATDFTGSVIITGVDEGGREVTWVQADSGTLAFTLSPDPCFSIKSIVFSDTPFAIDIRSTTDTDFTKPPLATIPAGSGVLRFRRFRTSQPSEDSTVHLLVKRAAPTNITDDTIIYLGNIGAIKHGLLGLIAEDNADIERSQFHWGMCGKLLDEELRSILGAAKPTLNVDLSGCGSALPIYNQY